MIKSILRTYCTGQLTITRLPIIRWLSFTYPLTHDTVHRDKDITIRPATTDDIALLAKHQYAQDNIIQSTLKFWHTYGFRSLYLGFFDGEEDPTVFQYVLDDQCNHLYQGMDYGAMYEQQGHNTVQVENIYMFRHKRKKKGAQRFEHHLFAELYSQGKRTVRTHIHTENRAAIIWARRVGFVPEKWICLVEFNLPLMRRIPKQFVQIPLQDKEYDSFPLNLFVKREQI